MSSVDWQRCGKARNTTKKLSNNLSQKDARGSTTNMRAGLNALVPLRCPEKNGCVMVFGFRPADARKHL